MVIKPKITVLMPVYNCENYVFDAVNSIVKQSYQDFEFLIIDDASTDATIDVIKRVNDKRIKLIEKTKNTGYTNSLNYGLEIARGEYIARMDGDDISMPKRFSTQINFLEKNKDVVACGSVFSIIGSNEIIKVPEKSDAIKIAMLNACAMAHPSVMIRKSVIDKYKIRYNLNKEPAEDYDLWVSLMKYGKLHNLQDVLLNYRVHSEQVSNLKKKKQDKSALATRIKLLKYACNDITLEEEENLKKVFKKDGVNFKDIQQFIKTKEKLLLKNTFFYRDSLIGYLEEHEKKIIDCYLLRRKKFTPNIYKEYIQLKNNLDYKLTPVEELKLFIKSGISYKYK